MKRLKPTTQFKKDLKRIRNNCRKAEILREVLALLENEQPIPEKYRPHMLKGDYSDCMEYHLQSDFLLVWFDPQTNEIDLLRLGSHSDLFGNGAKR